MSIAEFFIEWRDYGLRIALYNMVFMIVHRHDFHVRVWNDDD